jgi:hypothetical protein
VLWKNALAIGARIYAAAMAIVWLVIGFPSTPTHTHPLPSTNIHLVLVLCELWVHFLGTWKGSYLAITSLNLP